MNICIVHDSELGNGERLANTIRERLNSAGHTAIVGHERTLTPEQAIAYMPDLLIVGTAVRKFSLSPVTKRWIDRLGKALASHGSAAGSHVPRAAIFITHALKKDATERKGARIRSRLVSVLNEESVFPGWISARVIGAEGPFQDGVEQEVLRQIDAVLAWAGGTKKGDP